MTNAARRREAKEGVALSPRRIIAGTGYLANFQPKRVPPASDDAAPSNIGNDRRRQLTANSCAQIARSLLITHDNCRPVAAQKGRVMRGGSNGTKEHVTVTNLCPSALCLVDDGRGMKDNGVTAAVAPPVTFVVERKRIDGRGSG